MFVKCFKNIGNVINIANVFSFVDSSLRAFGIRAFVLRVFNFCMLGLGNSFVNILRKVFSLCGMFCLGCVFAFADVFDSRNVFDFRRLFGFGDLFGYKNACVDLRNRQRISPCFVSPCEVRKGFSLRCKFFKAFKDVSRRILFVAVFLYVCFCVWFCWCNGNV